MHSLKREGYKVSQIAPQIGRSVKTVHRMLRINPELLCVDGTQIHTKRKQLDPYKKQVQELLERGFQPAQIIAKLTDMCPDFSVKRTTMSDFCQRIRAEQFEYTQIQPSNAPALSEASILSPHAAKIHELLAKNNTITAIFTAIHEDGYLGSYSLLQQYCVTARPLTYRTKKAIHEVKRKELTTLIWSGKSDLPIHDMEYINANFPVFGELNIIVTAFRVAYSNKDVKAVKSWCEKYSECAFPAICSFINGINADSEPFYNSMKYEYSNGLLEGCVNKLKTIKRSMFGRASYALLRAKLFLMNGS